MMESEEEDRISALPDELIHHILSFLNAKLAVVMCVLSKRWVNLWRTLPYLNFGGWFIPEFLSNRDTKSDTSSVIVDLNRLNNEEILNYAISHNVKHLQVSRPWFMKCYLIFPVLETLHISSGDTSFMYWSFPLLTTLYLKEIHIGDIPLSFERFSKLKKLTIDSCTQFCDEEVQIKLPNLTTLTIIQWMDLDNTPVPEFMISAPKLSFFSYFGNYVSKFSSVGGGYPLIKAVAFDFDCVVCGGIINFLPIMELISLLRGFCGAKRLTLSLKTVQVFSTFLESPEFWPSPFGNLKTLHLVDPGSNRIINLIDSVNHFINYLLNSSPDLKIFVKDCSGKIRSYNPKMDILVKYACGYCKVKSKGNASPNRRATSNVQISRDELQSVVGVIPPALVPSVVNDDACSFNEKISFSLGDVSQIQSEYVDLLRRIKEEHPETFEHFAPQTKFIYTLGLNALCSSVKAFYEDSKDGFTVSGITCYKGLFADLERWGFNTMWLVNLLNNADKNSSVVPLIDDDSKKISTTDSNSFCYGFKFLLLLEHTHINDTL